MDFNRTNVLIRNFKETENFDTVIFKSRRKIKDKIYNLNHSHFKNQCIVDLDIRTKGIKLEKRSFMNLEVTLYVNKEFDVKSKATKEDIKNILCTIMDEGLIDKTLFNFHKTKK